MEPDLDCANETGLVCYDTKTFRNLASKKVKYEDCVVEIGCSFGACTTILSKTVGNHKNILALDIAQNCVETCQKSNPEVWCVKIDILKESLKF